MNGVESDAFKSNIGSPQGDALSPILFSIYLEHAIRKLQEKVDVHRPEMDKNSGIPHSAIYADDTDFISLCNEYLGKIQVEVTSVFGELSLIVNNEKTEHTMIGHYDSVPNHSWRKTKKFGSLLGIEEDVARRKMLAAQCFKKLEAIWKYNKILNKRTRMNTYKTLVESILLYNCSTWALSEGEANKLDVFQRKLIRQVLGYTWADKITNNDLYAEAGLEAASIQVVKARWLLFGHTMRLHEHTPARLAMLSYFNNANNDKLRLGRPAVTIKSCLSNEYMNCTGNKINNIDQYKMILHKAQDKIAWKQIVDDVVNVYKNALIEKKDKQSKKRKGCDFNEVIRGSECHYNLRNATKIYSGNECQNGRPPSRSHLNLMMSWVIIAQRLLLEVMLLCLQTLICIQL